MVRVNESTPTVNDDAQSHKDVSHSTPARLAGSLLASLQAIDRAALVAIMTLLFVLPVYLLTLPADLTWAFHSADGAELITAAVTLGIPHPPGYPTYVLLGKLFSLFVPLGNVAFRFNLLSTLLMSGAAALVAGTAYRWTSLIVEDETMVATSPFWAPLAGGLTFAFLPLIWQQAVVAEVYALNLFLLAALLFTLLDPRAGHRAGLSGLLLGLAITSHLTSLLILPLVLFLNRPQRWHRLLLGILLGLSPFLLLPIQALGGSPVVWGDPTTPAGWWWLVTAQVYQPNVLGLAPANWLSRLGDWLREASFLYLVAALVVFIARKRTYIALGKRFRLLALGCAAAYGAYAFFYDSVDAAVFLLPALLLATILVTEIAQRWSHYALFLPLALLVLHFTAVNMHAQTPVRSTVEEVMQDIPANALLITTGDRATFSLWYLKHVEGYRPDLIIVDANLFAFDWYRQRLAGTYTGLERLEKDDLAAFRTANAKRHPWCTFDVSVGILPERTVACLED